MVALRTLGLVLGLADFDAVITAVVLSGLDEFPVPVTGVPPSLLLDAFWVAFLTGGPWRPCLLLSA